MTATLSEERVDARATSVPMVARPWERRSEKVQPWHWDRVALVYVRQSTPQQVHDHQESTRLQYGLTGRAQALGWAEARVVVIDDDLGKSGASADGRPGFQRLVTEVSLDHVGIILGVEMSRLARSGKDWHQLLELCALFRTLIADLDGVYDPADYNDRLLLGLKGTMSEAELHILKQRMYQGRLNKARRGELAIPVPTGSVRRPSGEVAFDPDEQVQTVVRLIFRQFETLGTLNGVLRYLVRHEIQLGIRVRAGPRTGDLAWHRPTRMTLQELLRNPIHAGAYAYGRRQVDPRRQRPGRPHTGRRVIDPAGWLVLLPDRLPAYISWEQYERNLARLRANQARAEAIGAVRDGPALLAGLVMCGRCGQRMTVSYSGAGRRHQYVCGRVATDYGGDRCQQLAGPGLDRFVRQQVLAALEPAALELSLAAASQVEQARAELDRLWRQRLERAAYEVARAARQYQLAEPEHRLVARQLERAWEETLAAQQQLDEAYRRFSGEQPRLVSPAEQATIRRLAADLPALWDAPTTTDADREAIIRQVVERVTVAVQGESERVAVSITWAGGAQTADEIVRPVARLEQLSYYPQLVERLHVLAADGVSASTIAQRLNDEGVRPPKRRERFGPQGVQDLLHRLGSPTAQRRSAPPADLGVHEWGLADLARAVGMPPVTLFTWIRRGWVTGRQQAAEPSRRWILWADEAELERLRERHHRPTGDAIRRRCVEAP